MSSIQLSHIDKYYGQAHILKDVCLTIDDGEFMTLLGPSGCGKTTTLRVIAGLEQPQKGLLAVDGKPVVDCETCMILPPSKRNLDLVFQSYALWPHLTVFENIAFGLKLIKMPSEAISEKVRMALQRMQILQYADRYPNELSGGQQQRVAIARAIVSESSILLLDEPLSNLDAKLRIEMRSELKRLHQELKTTVVYVTHDQTEALTMSTRVAIFFEGVLAQCDKPMQVYRNPATLQVADFIGNPKINFVNATMEQQKDEATIGCALGTFAIRDVQRRRDILKAMNLAPGMEGSEVVLAIRPEHIQLHGDVDAQPDLLKFTASVYSVLPAGSETLVQLMVDDNLQILAKHMGENTLSAGDLVQVSIRTDCINVFDAKTGKILFGI